MFSVTACSDRSLFREVALDFQRIPAKDRRSALAYEASPKDQGG